jgi:dihydrofolate synthase/folylpolyglutamate synthase
MMTYTEAIHFLYHLRWFGTNLGLENPFKLAALAGHPQQQLRFIHIAGTNGKGSTCAMLESIYRTAGRRVGLFTSPHLVSFAERIQVNRRLIRETDVVRLVEELQPFLKTFPAAQHPTFFEVVTVMALRYFAEQQCDLVIWETGLGGRLDATNIVTPLATVITNVQLDHQQWLGDTLAQIAREKAGIIKPGVPVLTAADSAEALRVISDTAQQVGAPLQRVTPSDTERPPLNSIRLPLLGDHQRLNAALAVATVQALGQQMPITDESIRRGLETVQWAGRFHVVQSSADRTILLDGAHNPAGAETLKATLAQHFPGIRPALVLGLLRDKDCLAICRVLAPVADRLFLAPVDSERTASPQGLAELCRKENVSGKVIACPSLAEAMQQTENCPLVVVTGSLHFIGQAMECLGLSAGSKHSERSLNEWNASRAAEVNASVRRVPEGMP